VGPANEILQESRPNVTPEVQVVPDVEFVQLPFEYATERRKGIGLVAPFDFALDDECWRWLPKDVSLYVTRTARLEDTAVTAELAEAVGDTKAVMPCVESLISSEPSSVAYACTSGSFVGGMAGESLLRTAMRQAGAKEAVTTSGALLEALTHLGIKKLAIATPYNEELTRLLAGFLETAGIQVVKAGYLNSEQDIMHIGYDAVRNMAEIVDHPDADAIFFSCTNLRTFDIITELEEKYNKPVLSANQVTIWAALRAADIQAPRLPQRLFKEH
jgi:maleate isomerase